MKNQLLLLFLLLRLSTYAQKEFDYPQAPKDGTQNTYFGEVVYDPYQWMEDPEDPRLAEWLELQQKITKKQERSLTYYETLKTQIVTMYARTDRKVMDAYVKEKYEWSKYEFDYNFKSLDRTPDLEYKLRGSMFLKTLAKMKDFQYDKNDNVTIAGKSFSATEDSVAILMMHNGSDWRDAYFFDLIDGRQLTDTLKYLRIGSQIIWYKNGVYYDRYDVPKDGRELLDKATGQTLYYHKMGTPQSEDQKLLDNPDPTDNTEFSYHKMDSSRLVFYHSYIIKDKSYKAISYASMQGGDSFYLKNFLVYPGSESTWFNVNIVKGNTLIMSTNWGAPNGKVMTANISQKNKVSEFVPEFDVNLRQVNKLGKNHIACIYRNGGSFLALIYDLEGKLITKIDFPEGKKVNYFYESSDDTKHTVFSVSSFYHPELFYQLSLEDFSFKPVESVFVPFKHDQLETRYVKYKSKDGTEVPMYITMRKDLKLDGKNPTLIYGYGGYGITVEPSYDNSRTLWLLHGGILAIPNLRGGGAEGEAWSKAGRGLNKQNAIDDFTAAAEYLIDQNYTNPKKIAIQGGSHGGMLVGAAFTQRPDLYKAVIAEAGVYDMLRFNQHTIGTASLNIVEFGLPSDSLNYLNLRSYSPMHNVVKGVKYPNVLLVTGDGDDRVAPLHSYKFLATLQENGSPESLYHLYLTPGSGHGGALTTNDFLDELLFTYYFLFDELDVKFWDIE